MGLCRARQDTEWRATSGVQTQQKAAQLCDRMRQMQEASVVPRLAGQALTRSMVSSAEMSLPARLSHSS